ncbi:hypothetical protein [Bifidobacterium thermophilum]|uniref:hypothetical protein n=1 Tax=Bifidobacterium thermophilum TaxID=33905 RepID=UPI0015D57C08|nr:hypothetical protein [Bifidobacterium thermophilum]
MSIRIESLSGPSEAERQCVRRILQRYNLAHFETTDEQEFTIVARDDELTACGPLPLEPETVADASAASAEDATLSEGSTASADIISAKSSTSPGDDDEAPNPGRSLAASTERCSGNGWKSTCSQSIRHIAVSI